MPVVRVSKGKFDLADIAAAGALADSESSQSKLWS
jgi:hypothetical protein